MGEYFKIVNATKSQYIDNPLSDNKWHNILHRDSDTVQLLNCLICKSWPPLLVDSFDNEQRICGSWSGDEILIVGDRGMPDAYGVRTATQTDPQRNLYELASEQYEHVAEKVRSELEKFRLTDQFESDGCLIVNFTKRQYIDPLTFAEPARCEEMLGGIHGQALAYFYCRIGENTDTADFGLWSGDRIAIIGEKLQDQFSEVTIGFENVGFKAIKMLSEAGWEPIWYKGNVIIELPEGLSVGGDLNLSGRTDFSGLPKGLTIGGDLICSGVTEFPADLKVHGNIIVDGKRQEQ